MSVVFFGLVVCKRVFVFFPRQVSMWKAVDLLGCQRPRTSGWEDETFVKEAENPRLLVVESDKNNYAGNEDRTDATSKWRKHKAKLRFLEEALVQCGGDQMEGRTISPEKSPTIGPTAIAPLVHARSQEQNFMHVSRVSRMNLEIL